MPTVGAGFRGWRAGSLWPSPESAHGRMSWCGARHWGEAQGSPFQSSWGNGPGSARLAHG